MSELMKKKIVISSYNHKGVNIDLSYVLTIIR